MIGLSVSEFTARLASQDPAPGGGSAAALTGLMGISILEMVINGPEVKVVGGEQNERVFVKVQLAHLHGEAQQQIDRDAQAFTALIDAMALPENTQTQKTVKTQTLQAALQEAAEVPLSTSQVCLKAMELGTRLCDQIVGELAGDLAVGMQLLHAGILGCLWNAAMNIPHLQDLELAGLLQHEMKAVRKTSTCLLKDVQQRVFLDKNFAILREE